MRIFGTGRFDVQDSTVGTHLCNAANHVYSDVLVDLALKSGHLSERDVVRQEIQFPALLDPVHLRIAIQLNDLVDRLFVTKKSERRDRCARTHSCDSVELGHCEWVLGQAPSATL